MPLSISFFFHPYCFHFHIYLPVIDKEIEWPEYMYLHTKNKCPKPNVHILYCLQATEYTWIS